MALHTFHFPDEMSDELHQAAASAGQSVNEFIAAVLEEHLGERHHAEVMAAARRIAESDAAIVHRLGTI
jgi:hypothetical protein